MNQNEQILEYMKEHGAISQREAVKLGCYRLSARIHDLRRMGYIVIALTKRFETPEGRCGHYAEYRLAGKAD